MRLQASALVVMLFGMLALSVISMMPFVDKEAVLFQNAYADEASATVTYKTVGGAASARSCSAITEDSENNVWMACNTTSSFGSSLRLYLIDATGSILHDVEVSSSNIGSGARLVYEGTLVGGFETVLLYTPGSSVGANSQHTLRMYYYNTTAGQIQSNGSLTVSSCTDVGFANLNKISDNYYFACNDASGQIRIVANQLFQFNSYSGIKTGSPTCSSLNAIHMYSTLRGVAVCDSTTLIQFSLSGSTITKGDSITVTQSVGSAKMLFASNKIFANVGGSLYVIPFNTSTNMFTDGDNSDVLALDASITDFVIGGGNMLHAVDSNINGYFMFNTAVADPTATLVFTALSGFEVGGGAKISQMTDNISFLFSKGQSADSNYNYFTITNIISGTVPGIGGIDGSAPGSFGSEFCRDTTGDGLYDTCLTVRDAPAGMYCTDSDGDGVYDDCARTTGSITTTAPVLVALFTGITGEASNVLLGMVAPMAFLLLAGATAATGKVQLPMFVFGIAFLGGVGVSVAIGWLESWWLVVGIMGFATSFAGEIKKIFG